MTQKMIRVGVIGAGVVGLSSAINVLASIPKASVRIIADQIGHQTVSYGAGGLFRPDMDKLVLKDQSNYDMMEQCVRDSWHHFVGLAMSEKAQESGQMLVPGIVGHRKSMEKAYTLMRELVFNFRQLKEEEIKRIGYPEEFKYAYSYITVVSQGNAYMDWLYKLFISKGGKVERRTVNNMKELYGQYDVIINCCGLRAMTFLGDKNCFPTRGQLALVKAPWFKQFHYLDTDVYVIPHMDKVCVGGIRIDGDGDTTVKPEVTKKMLKNAEAIFPQLKGAELLSEWANSRPGRTSIRLEQEVMDFGENRKLHVVHNYGHGGHGVTLSWGTAVYATKLAKQIIASKFHTSSL